MHCFPVISDNYERSKISPCPACFTMYIHRRHCFRTQICIQSSLCRPDYIISTSTCLNKKHSTILYKQAQTTPCVRIHAGCTRPKYINLRRWLRAQQRVSLDRAQQHTVVRVCSIQQPMPGPMCPYRTVYQTNRLQMPRDLTNQQ